MNLPVLTPPDRPPRTLSRDRRRVQLIEATISTIAARGHARTTLADVARAAGISHGLVLFHFGSKENLLAETLGYLAEEYQKNWQAALAAAPSDPASQLLALIEADFLPAMTTPDRLAAWCAYWGEAQSRPTYQVLCGDKDAEHIQAMERLCKAVIQREGSSHDPVHVARILRLVVEGTWLDMMTDPVPYTKAEAQRTVMTAVRLFFPNIPTESSTTALA
jgi:TetR/AcrR family transcriptional regulator, transcriptional repressor of bet genes